MLEASIPQRAPADVDSGPTRQEKLEGCIGRIAQSESVPAFCNNSSEILLRTLDMEEGSSQKLVQVVLQDAGLAAQVLRLANSAMYNHSRRPIMNVSDAIAVLGWPEVRSMAGTVRYLEHFASRSPGLRELAVSSVLTAVQSREVAAVLGYPRPEEAYICGLFRNLGEVLIACHYPEEHAGIIRILEEEKIPERAACLRVLDFFWDDVGKSIAALWQLPQAVRSSMEPPSGAAADRCLASVTQYSHNLTRALYRKSATIDTVHLEPVINPAGQPVWISGRDLHLMVDLAVAETRELFSALQIPTETLRISRQAELAREALEALSEPMNTRAGLEVRK